MASGAMRLAICFASAGAARVIHKNALSTNVPTVICLASCAACFYAIYWVLVGKNKGYNPVIPL